MRSSPRAGGAGTTVGLALALLSALSFATSGPLARSLMDAGWSAQAVVIARVGLGALALAVPAVVLTRGRAHLWRANAGVVVLFGVLAVAGAQAGFFHAVKYLPVGVALLLEYLGVVLVVGWTWAVHGQRPRQLTVAGTVAALAGLVLILDLTGSGLHPVGVLWGLVAAVGLAGYFILAARADDSALPPVALAGAGMAVGAVVLLGFGLAGALPLEVAFDEVDLLGHRVSWLVPVAGLVGIAAVVSYLTGIAATRRLGARPASFVGLTEVVFAVLLAWLVLGELPRPVQLLGGLLILVGVALVRLDGAGPAPATADGEPRSAATVRPADRVAVGTGETVPAGD